MSKTNTIILTKEGYVKLKKELNELKNIKRTEISERIKQAISFGDLSENSEYEDAKIEQSHLESRISDLEKNLNNVKIIQNDNIGKKTIEIGSKIQIKNLKSKENILLTIVGSLEFDPDKMKISNQSLLGKKLLGKKIGDIVVIKNFSNETTYEIKKII